LFSENLPRLVGINCRSGKCRTKERRQSESTIFLRECVFSKFKKGDAYEDYFSIVTHKTASLIEAASHMGAILGGVKQGKEMAMKRFGHNIGIAFQCMDDTLDYIATEEELGKDIGKDLKEGKITLPLIHALENASPEEEKTIISAVEREDLGEREVNSILELIKKYQGIEYSIQKAQNHAQEAKHMINGFSLSPEKEALLAVADYVIERRS